MQTWGSKSQSLATFLTCNMACFKKSGVDTYNFNGDSDSREPWSGRREGIYTGTKQAALEQLENIQEHVKTAQEEAGIRLAIGNSAFMSDILRNKELLDQIVKAMAPRDITEHESIMLEGDEGSEMYISSSGIYNVLKQGKKVAIFSDKRIFGELALLYKSKRPVTIRSVSKGKLWVLDRKIYQSIMVQNAMKHEDGTLSSLRKVPGFNKFSNDKLQRVVSLFTKEYYSEDTVIIDEDKKCDKFYMVSAGWAVGTRDKLGKIAEYRVGDFFGEGALSQENYVIADTITAKETGVELLVLPRKVFLEYFNQNTEDKTLVFEPVLQDEHLQSIKLNELEKIATIGRGGFGKVDLVNYKVKNLTFALKFVNRADVVEFDQIDNVFSERDIQLNTNSLFIVRMFKTFKDTKYLYFLLEPCMGGDLWSLLQNQKNKNLPVNSVKFYTGCVIEALEYLHQRNCVYRDLKPENVLLDGKGYAKITDFGFAKVLTSSKTYTFVGTPQYLSPEVILNQGYNHATDYWALGIFTFELLTGRTPFESKDPSHLKTYQMILSGTEEVEFPKSMSLESVDFVKKLCKCNPAERLGCLKNGISDIRNTRLFYGFKWSTLRNRKMKAPHVPQLTHALDTRYFDINDGNNYIPPDESGDWADKF